MISRCRRGSHGQRHGSRLRGHGAQVGEIHCERLSPTVQSLEALVVSGTRNHRRLDPKRWPDPGKPPSAELYAVVGGLIVWLLVDVLPHVHISIGWH